MTLSTAPICQEVVKDLSVQEHRDLVCYTHWHSDLEVVFVAEGRLRVVCNLESEVLGAGSFAVLMPNDVHAYQTEGPSRSIVFRIRPDLLDPELQKGLGSTRFRTAFQKADALRTDGLAARLDSIFLTLLDEERALGPLHYTAALCRVNEFFVLALRSMPTLSAEDLPKGRDRRNAALMRDVADYIDLHLSEDITLESIAEHFHLCQFYFSRLFKRMFGINLKEYVNRTRTHKAKELLFRTDMKITSISFECGYGSVRQFNRIFRENTGYAPSVFRDLQFTLHAPDPAIAG